MPFNTHNKDNIEVRPRFKLVTKKSPDAVLKKIMEESPKEHDVNLKVKGNHVFLTIPEEEQHYWSPAMEVVVEKHRDNEEHSYIRCLIGPKQTVWMMVMFFYIAVGVIVFFGGMYGLVKWNMGKETNLLWIIPAGIIIDGFIFLGTKWGQRRGRDQMYHLVSFLYHAIDDNEMVRL